MSLFKSAIAYSWRCLLKPLGIEKVAPNGTVTFAPEERQKEILNKGAELGEAMARVNDFQKRIEAANYNDEVHWEYAAVILNPNQRAEYYDQLDERAAWFYEAVTISDQMVSQTEDPDGQVYLAAYKDGDGNWLDGSNSYKLTVPANPLASKFWSLTVYDNNARVLIDNDTEKPDFSCWTECLLDLIVSSHSGIPFFMRTGDGNESDKAVFGKILSDVKK